MADTLVGHVYSIVYNSEDYYILNFDVDSRNVKAKGNIYGLANLSSGIPIKFVGRWTSSPKYGREFQIQTWEPNATDEYGIRHFLRTCINGFNDNQIIDAVVGRFGVGTFEALKNPNDVLTALPDVDQDSLERAVFGWERAISQRDLSALLKEGGLGGIEVQAAMTHFGMDAAKVVAENPFRLMEVPGIAFTKVDKLAATMGIGAIDPRRLQGAVLWGLQEASRQGHLYLKRSELNVQVGDLIQQEDLLAPLPLGETPMTAYNGAILQLARNKSVVYDGEAGIYLPSLHTYERKSADLLSKLLLGNQLEYNPETFIETYERANKITLSDAQKGAIKLLGSHNVLVITGLPGTGKTTVLRAAVRLLEESQLHFHLMAPTGIAAKRLSSVAGHDASTIHRALKFDGKSWGHSENNRFVTDAVVLDEASMMDQELFYRLLSALRPGSRLVLVGDDAQLPSVGPGNVLRELIDCPQVPHVRLTEIFRQSIKGEIVTSSHRINAGKMPDLSTNNTESEFRFVRTSDETEILRIIVAMAEKLKARNANFQVLSPKYDGIVGVDNLNDKLRDALNPEGPAEWIKGQQRFRKGDRLMVVANDYDLGVYNGDVGKLDQIGKEGVIVKIHGVGDAPAMMVPFKNAAASSKLRLAYAITVHKSQGSEFDTIILPIVKSQGRMLQRNLLYTAITRAKKRVWLIGEEVAIMKAVENNKVVKRNTVLSKAVQACLAKAVPPAEAVNGAEQ